MGLSFGETGSAKKGQFVDATALNKIRKANFVI
jgi:hypothetical protein